MEVVLIHWRIKPTEEAEAAFFCYWKHVATIDDKSSLAAEYLSAPMSPQEVPFPNIRARHPGLQTLHQRRNMGDLGCILRTGRKKHEGRCSFATIRG